MKRLRQFMTVMVVCCMTLTMSAGAIRDKASVDAGTAFDMVLAPATQGQADALAEENNIRLAVEMDSSNFVHDTEIPLDLQVQLDSMGWDTTLQGDALVYNQNDQVVLFGMASGYNGEMEDENFLSINFTYDVGKHAAIANVTYDILDVNNKHLEFGQNTDLFADAYRYLEDKMTSVHDKQVADENEILEVVPYVLDTSPKLLFQSGPSTCAMRMYVPQNIYSSGSGPVSAIMRGSTYQAEKDILKFEDSAWAVSATNCDVSFFTVEGLRYIRGQQHPASSETNVSVSIPLPLSQSYTFNWNVERVNASTTSNELACHWNTYDRLGIDNIESADGPAFTIDINQSGNKYGNLKITGSAKIGYHYLYIDGTGRENNTTWYSRMEDYGYTNVVSA